MCIDTVSLPNVSRYDDIQYIFASLVCMYIFTNIQFVFFIVTGSGGEAVIIIIVICLIIAGTLFIIAGIAAAYLYMKHKAKGTYVRMPCTVHVFWHILFASFTRFIVLIHTVQL